MTAVGIVVAGCTPTRTPEPGGTSPAVSPGATGTPTPTPATTPTPTEDPVVPDPAASATAPPAPGASLDGVTVALTVAGYLPDTREVVVTGYADVVGDGGTCVASLARAGSAPVTVSAPAAPDATTTSCALSIPRSALTAGTWSATLTYQTAGGSVTSPATDVEVPA
ncbi:hypothetical protein [Cellulomonas sp. Leaf395]|uniref:hypothetical protein n=1 Tax=Cellulomonas sp. Leaf395 TaxID=1736362 RepID=UPI0006FF8D9F|nr:hypothetical protein [Cellulomonas sp. Leaf395]KQS99776.1 hypothetical protein ASG23_10625 [Cellulomonas sp. Leaf395]